MKRYELECKQLANLAMQQLNLEKNACKENFEELSFSKILEKLAEELMELGFELFDNEKGCELPCEKIIFLNAFNEIGDVTACIVGLLAKINKLKDEAQNDGA